MTVHGWIILPEQFRDFLCHSARQKPSPELDMRSRAPLPVPGGVHFFMVVGDGRGAENAPIPSMIDTVLPFMVTLNKFADNLRWAHFSPSDYHSLQ